MRIRKLPAATQRPPCFRAGRAFSFRPLNGWAMSGCALVRDITPLHESLADVDRGMRTESKFFRAGCRPPNSGKSRIRNAKHAARRAQRTADLVHYFLKL